MAMVPAQKGALVTVPLWIEANVPVEGFLLELDYTNLDGNVSLERIMPVLQDGRQWEVSEIDSQSATVRAIFSQTDPAAFLPAGAQHEVLRFEFMVDAGGAGW